MEHIFSTCINDTNIAMEINGVSSMDISHLSISWYDIAND